MIAIVWFRNDLRLTDNPALEAAIRSGYKIFPLYIWDEESMKLGSANRWWLHHSLKELGKDLESVGGKLILKKGNSFEVLKAIVDTKNVSAIYWNRRYDLDGCHQDGLVKSFFKKLSVNVESFNGNYLFDPYLIRNKKDSFFQVFTPFWRHCLNAYTPLDPPLSRQKLENMRFNQSFFDSDQLEQWNFIPTKPNWAKGFEEIWNPGERGAKNQLNFFLDDCLDGYAIKRDFPNSSGTSRLSPHLRFGEISPRTVWWEIKNSSYQKMNLRQDSDSLLRELGWREFANYLLYYCPQMPYEPIKKEFLDFPWCHNNDFLKRWQQGCTGYPIVDAGMKELWNTGWMHNRVRMIVASFLVKHLQIHWKQGELWFFDTLLDADVASNSMNWQWIAGCGCDAAPYFRIFNPILQGRKFDADGAYIKKWVCELQNVDSRFIHAPWEIEQKKINYSSPIVNHEEARARALQSYKYI